MVLEIYNCIPKEDKSVRGLSRLHLIPKEDKSVPGLIVDSI